MDKIIKSAVAKKASELTKVAEENVTLSRRVFTLEILVALLGGIVIGMFLSPRRNSSYTIASNNNIHDGSGKDADEDNDEDEDEYDEDDDDENDAEQSSDVTGNRSKFIKL